MTTVETPASRPGADTMLRDYHDARRREDQWRIPQLLTALLTPLAALISVLFVMAGRDAEAIAAGGLAIVAGVVAALLAVEVWRWHRTAIGIGNRFRTEYPADGGLFLKDPL